MTADWLMFIKDISSTNHSKALYHEIEITLTSTQLLGTYIQ